MKGVLPLLEGVFFWYCSSPSFAISMIYMCDLAKLAAIKEQHPQMCAKGVIAERAWGGGGLFFIYIFHLSIIFLIYKNCHISATKILSYNDWRS